MRLVYLWGQPSRFGRGLKRRAYHGKKWYWVRVIRGDPAPWPLYFLKMINIGEPMEEDECDDGFLYAGEGFYFDFKGDSFLTPDDE